MKSRCFSASVVVVLLVATVPSLLGQSILGFSPNVGTSNDVVVISTSGFPSSGTVVVTFFNNKASIAPVLGPSPNQITARVPTGAATGLVSVKVGASATVNSFDPFTVIGREPYVSGFVPMFASVNNELITFSGVHLTNVTVVKFNGVSQTSLSKSADGMSLTARVPVGAPLGTNTIVMTNPFGSFTSAVPFTVIGPGPYIASFSPQFGSAGSRFDIFGTHFTGTTAVKVNGTNVAAFNVQSETQITATNRTDVTTGFIIVSNPSGSYTSATFFYIPPVISSFTPTNGVAGTVVTLTGQNFLNTTNVQVGGVNAAFTAPTNNTNLVLTVPAGAPTGKIRADTPSGTPGLSAVTFRLLPTITGFSPIIGRPGTNVTIFGANLNEGLSTVKFNGTNATFNPPAFGSVVAVVPGGAMTGPISLTTSNGTVSSGTNFFLPALIAGFTPTNSPVGSTVTITGQNFLGATVSFNGQSATLAQPANNTNLQVTVPANVITGPISVTTPAGTTNSSPLLFYGMPGITNFTPTHGFPGTNVTIIGTNFIGTSFVRFDGTNASFTVVNNGQINTVVPNTFTGPLTVVAPAGTAAGAIPFTLDFTSELGVQVSAAPDPVFIGGDLTYTILVSNGGPFAAPNVRLTNALPASAILKSSVTTAGTLATNASQVIGSLGTLAVSGSATITVVVVPQAAGTIVDGTTVGSSYADLFPSNNNTNLAVVVYPLPVLAIQRYTATQVQISWPLALTNFTLQSAAALTTNTAWSNVGTPPIPFGDQLIVIDPLDPAPKFYRLKR